MSTGLILAVDQGTTNTKALLVDRSGSPVFRTSASVGRIKSREGFVEQDPIEIWSSVLRVCAEAVMHAHSSGARIEAVGISNQRETAIAWDAQTGLPLANAIGWQCTRSAEICDRIAHRSDFVRSVTGLPLAPLISAGKWTWLLENEPSVQEANRKETLRFGTVDSWLLHRMTAGTTHATDLTNASRTGLLNLATLQWDRELLDLFGIPGTAMPQLKPSTGHFGVCSAIRALENVPLLSMAGDSHAAMFGHGRFGEGTIKSTYGTGSSVMALTSGLVANTPCLSRTIAWSVKGNTQFALEGNIAMTGSAIQWLGEFFEYSDASARIADMASTVKDAGGVYFVPAMLGLSAPHWDAAARGAVVGLGLHHTRAHLSRAALDSIAYQVADVIFAVEATTGTRCKELRVDGGATRNADLMQFQADILGRPVLRSRNEELSAIGAAWLAGLELGWWKSFEEIETVAQESDSFNPGMTDRDREHLYQGWKTAVESVRSIARSNQ